MATTAIIEITQFETEDKCNSVNQFTDLKAGTVSLKELAAGTSASATAGHLPPVMQPVSRTGTGTQGWPTSDNENWSDSPTNEPNKLYRYRFSWGRDEQELFSYRGLDPLPLEDPGQQWGNLDDMSGILTYEREYPLSSSVQILLIKHKQVGRVLQRTFEVSNEYEHIKELGVITGEADLTQFPFLLIAKPEPYSIKNPITTDVYIRMSNFTFPIASGTINLFLDDVLQPDESLQIDEFFGGLGGFDVTWANSFNFDYDAQVDVRWEFRDTDVPSNKFELAYPFYTVKDLAGPRVSNLIPTDQALGVPITGPIQFDLEDFENDVDIDTLVLYVNNVLITNGENGTIETFRFQNEKGYTVRFTPEEPWLYGDLIPVAIFVQDTSVNENQTFFTYSFTTLESTAPRMLNLRPLACSLAIPTGTDISVDVIDGGHGIDKDSIVFTVEDIERSGQIALIPIVHRDD